MLSLLISNGKTPTVCSDNLCMHHLCTCFEIISWAGKRVRWCTVWSTNVTASKVASLWLDKMCVFIYIYSFCQFSDCCVTVCRVHLKVATKTLKIQRAAKIKMTKRIQKMLVTVPMSMLWELSFVFH